MIVIVGHGPSLSAVPPDFDIDQHTVVRLRRAELLIGTRTDVICSSQLRYSRAGIEFWHLTGAIRSRCVEVLKPYAPSFSKPSTGLSAAILARDKWPDAEIGVVGFDYTMHPDRAAAWQEKSRHNRWIHDAHAENACIRDLEVIEIA